jgi:hypothetical protein
MKKNIKFNIMIKMILLIVSFPIEPQSPQPTINLTNTGNAIPMGIFNGTNDTIYITYIGLFSGSMFYDLSNSQACTISDIIPCSSNHDCNINNTSGSGGYCSNGQCTHSLPPNAYNNSLWQGTYISNSNYKYISGFIMYTINGNNYQTKVFSFNNQDQINISFTTSGVSIFGGNSTSANDYPANCSSDDPTQTTGGCGCLKYPDASVATGSPCSFVWFSPVRIIPRSRNLGP